MSLEDIAEAMKTFPGLTRKRAIHEIVDLLPVDRFPRVAAARGEDAAAIEHGDGYILLSTDGIMESLVESDPFLAGYYAVLVNVNDIAAMGGNSLAMVDVMSMSEGRICREILRGLEYGVKKFDVPIVGGHTHPDCVYHAIDVAIIGEVPRNDIILSSTACTGDDVVFVMDLDGFYPESVPYSWNSTFRKDPSYVQAQMAMLPKLASEHLVHSGKDLSNPGTVGTLAMMLETSCKGAAVDMDLIPMPEKERDLIHWNLAYQGYGFVFSCAPENSQRVIDMFAEVGCDGAVAGTVTNDNKLTISSGDEKIELFDFTKDIITGCGPEKKL